MSSIPMSAIINVLPSVEGATGNELILNGLMLSTSWRTPTGTIVFHPSAATVGAVFGTSSQEYLDATVYFNGFTGRTQVPSEIGIVQWTPSATPALLQGGIFDSLTIPQVQAINGTLNITIDGYAFSGSLNLSGATSYTAAAGLIQTAINTSLPAGAVSAATGGTIATNNATFTGYVDGQILNVTTAPGAALAAGAVIQTPSSLAGFVVTGQLSGTTGGVGTYALNQAANVASTSITANGGLLTLTGNNASGTFSVGQTITGTGVTAGTKITALGTGTGAAGTYYTGPTAAVSGITITGTASAAVVTFDAISGSLLVQSGSMGAGSTITFATGAVSSSLFLTAQTGATVSQGASATTAATFMNNVVNVSQDWASFWTTIDPDDGTLVGPTQKLAFASWNNSQNNRYAYLGWDTDTTPTTSGTATPSFGYQVNTVYDYSGTMPIYDPTHESLAAFAGGFFASLDFNATNGRTTLAFRDQTGIVASVTNALVASNLQSNGYNFVGAYATANQNFIWFYPGSISGPFLWADSYANEIAMNAEFQLDLAELVSQVGSIPYNAYGAALIEGSCQSTIDKFKNFGAIRAGVQLSSLEIEEVNSQAGIAIDQALFSQGWFFQVQQATAAVRQARGSPPCFFWYVDGQSVQKITLNSIELL